MGLRLQYFTGSFSRDRFVCWAPKPLRLFLQKADLPAILKGIFLFPPMLVPLLTFTTLDVLPRSLGRESFDPLSIGNISFCYERNHYS